MPTPKRRGQKQAKRKFSGNRFTKKRRLDDQQQSQTASTSVSSSESESDNECESGKVEQFESATNASATPTQSERKIHDLYDLPSSCDESDCQDDCDTGSDTDTGYFWSVWPPLFDSFKSITGYSTSTRAI